MQVRSSGRMPVAICGAILAVAAPQAAPVSASGGGEVQLAFPHRVSAPKRSEERPASGELTMRLPAGWRRRRDAKDRHDAHLVVPLGEGCKAEVEVQAGISWTTKPIAEEVRQYVDFWFDTEVPAPVEAVASHSSPGRRWVLATTKEPGPRPGHPGTTYSPFFGVLVRQIAPHVWASVGLGPRVPQTCPQTPARDDQIERGLRGMLRSARIAVHL